MTDRPIIFSAPMVRALLDGRKTQTRRLVRNKTGVATCDGFVVSGGYPYTTGDRLYVREGVRFDAEWDACKPSMFDRADAVYYEADARKETHAWGDPFVPGRLRSPIHMPRWASRLTLTVTDVRVQRLQEISEDDARAEGVKEGDWPDRPDCSCNDDDCLACSHYPALYKPAFRHLWNSLHGADAWIANPWVAALTFTVQRGNIDQVTP